MCFKILDTQGKKKLQFSFRCGYQNKYRSLDRYQLMHKTLSKIKELPTKLYLRLPSLWNIGWTCYWVKIPSQKFSITFHRRRITAQNFPTPVHFHCESINLSRTSGTSRPACFRVHLENSHTPAGGSRSELMRHILIRVKFEETRLPGRRP